MLARAAGQGRPCRRCQSLPRYTQKAVARSLLFLAIRFDRGLSTTRKESSSGFQSLRHSAGPHDPNKQPSIGADTRRFAPPQKGRPQSTAPKRRTCSRVSLGTLVVMREKRLHPRRAKRLNRRAPTQREHARPASFRSVSQTSSCAFREPAAIAPNGEARSRGFSQRVGVSSRLCP
jgi:hypothetical protein